MSTASSPLTLLSNSSRAGQPGLADAMKIPKPERTQDDFPVFYRFGWGGIESPDFRGARVSAYRYVGMEELAKRYENYEPEFATENLAV